MSVQPGTPLPWIASAPDGSYHDVIRLFADADPEGALPVAVVPQRHSAGVSVLMGCNNDTTEAALNAAYIEVACNSFPELVAALEATLDGLERASRQLSEEHKMALGGKQWGGLLIENARAALSALEVGGESRG